MIEVVIPALGARPADAFARSLGGARSLAPFDPRAIEFVAALSAELFRDPACRAHPAIQALAFGTRRAAVTRLAAAVAATRQPDIVRVPVGVVFHVPPANVDTLFIYSWLFAFLAGNRSVVRLPSRTSPVLEAVLAAFERVRAAWPDPEVAEASCFVRYGHEEAITAALTRACDLRVIWGGDATIETLRRIPAPPAGRDLCFPDRWSLAALRAEAVAELPERALEELAARLYADTYWFGQQACSSPRLLAWVGGADAAQRAQRRLVAALAGELERRGEEVDPSTALGRETLVNRLAADGLVESRLRAGAALWIVALAPATGDAPGDPPLLVREHTGGGLFLSLRIDRLAQLAARLGRRDQTLAHFGFEAEELGELVRILNGRALDRVVPIGEALLFDRIWDGVDLIEEMTRRVHLVTTPRQLR
ncbi:acyl-CoA reductase [Anaeromyxobacter paludicola]|uniref:Long-chain-fatty-acyl-CoA reductase n=1 Tax=Anaeromyxobacter paludicola TaxID=2918171 RepID=A0ABM7X5L2_9BACT|nr:acyl-CoA reductase [Anaeromyxobacter paludicola]BDG07092.1 hypothetical protein AMPC_02050 [Anaeromyxobacter paludicola]